MKKKIITVLITSLLICVLIPSVALAVEETADFNGLGYGDDGDIPISTSIDGFVFTAITSGANVGMKYAFGSGDGTPASNCIYPDDSNGAVSMLLIRRDDGSDFKLTSMWLNSNLRGSLEVKLEGYDDGSPVIGCSKSNVDISGPTNEELNWLDNIDEIRIIATELSIDYVEYDVAAYIDTIVYEIDTAPTVDTNTGISLNEGATTTIKKTHLLSSDDNDGDNDITYTITDLPDNGVLKNNGSTLSSTDTFTQDDINYNRVTYVHDDTNTTSDNFKFKVSDSSSNESTVKTFNITVIEVDDDTPTISINTKLTLDEGAAADINTYLLADDVDTDNATLTFTITSGPSNGQVENTDNPGNAISSFTQANITNGKIQYVHGDGNNTSDSFIFKVADGMPNELTDQTFNIEITPVDDDTPTISINNGYPDPSGPTDPLLYEGGACSISDEHLEAEDTDTNDAFLIYIVTTLPSNGEIKKDGSTLLLNGTFMQQDIIDGNIQYVHDGSNTTSDSFIFKVTDGTNELTGQTFDLTITAVDDDTPTILTNNGLPDYPYTSPVRFYTGETMSITLDFLEANDTDTDNATLTYTITSAPSHGQVENSDNVGVAITSFTQQNLIDGKIQYVHDGGSSTSDSFIFKVADGVPNELTGQTFSIDITVSVSSITFDNSEVTMNVGVTSALGTTFPHTVSPSNAANKNTTFTSSNPAVATVNNTTGMVTAIAPGITKITATSDEKPAIKDECILKVQDLSPPPVGAKGGTIAGKLIDNIGNPLVGYRVTLCSTPITVITNSLGEFQFPATTFSNHILIVNDPAMHEITRFALGFTQGANTNATIDNMTNTIAITYANSTATINVDLQSNLAGDDIAANDVVFVSNAVAYADLEVSNPETGDDSIPYGIIACIIGLIIIVGLELMSKVKISKKQ